MGAWKVVLWIGVVALALWFLFMVKAILLPFILGLIIAILLEPLVRRLRLKGVPRSRSVLLVFGSFFVILLGISIWAIPVITNQVVNFSTGLSKVTQQFAADSYRNNHFVRWNPVYVVQRSTSIDPIARALGEMRPTLERFGLPTTREGIVERYVEPRRKEISSLVQGFFNSFLGILSSLGSQLLILPMTPIVALLLLFDFDGIRARAPGWIPPSIRRQTLSIVGDVGEVFIAYLRGMTISWALYTTVVAIVLSVFGAPYGVLLALLFGALYLIPFIGGMINYVTLFTITVLSGTTGNWMFQAPSPFIFALILVGIQLFITWGWDTFVHPNLVGHAVGLSPLVSMFVVFSGAALFGLFGMLLAFPIGGAMKVILERLLRVTSTTGSDTLGLPAVPLRHRVSDG